MIPLPRLVAIEEDRVGACIILKLADGRVRVKNIVQLGQALCTENPDLETCNAVSVERLQLEPEAETIRVVCQLCEVVALISRPLNACPELGESYSAPCEVSAKAACCGQRTSRNPRRFGSSNSASVIEGNSCIGDSLARRKVPRDGAELVRGAGTGRYAQFEARVCDHIDRCWG